MIRTTIIGGILAAALLYGITVAYANEECSICNETIYELVYRGSVISFGDMTEEECQALLDQLETQTAPFTELTCQPRDVLRERI